MVSPVVGLILRSSLDPDARDWAARVTANGGSVSGVQKKATSDYVRTLKAAGTWAKINRLNLFMGDQFAACLVPLKVGGGSAVETNTNFVSGDYSPTTGLTGNGTTKKLNTGLSILALTKSDFGMGTWCRTNPAAGTMCDIGSSYSATGATDRFYNFTSNGASAGQAGMGAGLINPTGWSGVTGLLSQETTGTTTQNAFANGANVGTAAWNNDGFQAGTVTVFNGAGPFFSSHSLAGYYVGNNLDQLALKNAWAALNATLGR